MNETRTAAAIPRPRTEAAPPPQSGPTTGAERAPAEPSDAARREQPEHAERTEWMEQPARPELPELAQLVELAELTELAELLWTADPPADRAAAPRPSCEQLLLEEQEELATRG